MAFLKFGHFLIIHSDRSQYTFYEIYSHRLLVRRRNRFRNSLSNFKSDDSKSFLIRHNEADVWRSIFSKNSFNSAFHTFIVLAGRAINQFEYNFKKFMILLDTQKKMKNKIYRQSVSVKKSGHIYFNIQMYFYLSFIKLHIPITCTNRKPYALFSSSNRYFQYSIFWFLFIYFRFGNYDQNIIGNQIILKTFGSVWRFT